MRLTAMVCMYTHWGKTGYEIISWVGWTVASCPSCPRSAGRPDWAESSCDSDSAVNSNRLSFISVSSQIRGLNSLTLLFVIMY